MFQLIDARMGMGAGMDSSPLQHGSHESVQNVEDFKSMAWCFSLEMDRVKAQCSAQKQLYEAKVQVLQQKLAVAITERDEAQKSLVELQQRLQEMQKQKERAECQQQQQQQTYNARINNNATEPSILMHSSDSRELLMMKSGKQADAFPSHQTTTTTTTTGGAANAVKIESYAHRQQLQEDEEENLWSASMAIPGEPTGGGHGNEIVVPLGPKTGHSEGQGQGQGFQKEEANVNLNLNMNLKVQHLPRLLDGDTTVAVQEEMLPEKGKLLQAVMQAGPLLETLLLAGPLPQWQRPPPALDPAEISNISMPIFTPPQQQQQDSSPVADSQLSSSKHCPASPNPPPPYSSLLSELASSSSGPRLPCGPTGVMHGM